MSVSNGQKANATTFNNAFLSTGTFLPFKIQVSDTITNGQSATNVTGWTLDAASFSSALYLVEFDRVTTTVDQFANGFVWLQRRAGVWRIEIGLFNGDVSSGEPAGVTLTVTEAGGIAQVQAATDTLGGVSHVGTILQKALAFAV